MLNPQYFRSLFPLHGGALRGEQEVTEPVQIPPHLPVHQLLLDQRNHGALGAAAHGAGQVQVRGAEPSRLQSVGCGS